MTDWLAGPLPGRAHIPGQTWVILAAVIFLLPVAGAVNAGTPAIRSERVQFAKGASSAVFKGQLKGDATVDYTVRAGAGQTLAVTLKGRNSQNYFNVNPPESETSMFVGSISGSDFTGMLPTDGDYVIRVYLMRAAARRNESTDYTLTIGVTGSALAPLPASKDAVLPGTPFHASARIACVPYLDFEKKQRECEAFVIRRGVDGTATVEIPLPGVGRRRILYVKGKPVASDSPEPLAFTRQGDVTTVKLGADERYEIPDALVAGG